MCNIRLKMRNKKNLKIGVVFMSVTVVKPVRANYRDMEVGERIVMVEPVKNGLIELNPMDEGKIIYLQNQVEATVWFRHIGHYSSESIVQALEVDTNIHKNGRMDGITVQLKRSSFAVKYNPYSEKQHSKYAHLIQPSFDEVTVNEQKALNIPFFVINENYRQPSCLQMKNANGDFETTYQYELGQVVNIVNDGFTGWVEQNTETRPITEDEKENGNYPDHWETCLTEESSNKVDFKKRELELAFAKATGVFYEFTGGLIWE